MKKVVISCGPIPSKLDSVKYITNRFKGRLAFTTVDYLAAEPDYDLTVVIWKYTELPHNLDRPYIHVVKVDDVVDYYRWFEENAVNYDAFIMAAAVANLMSAEPFEGKFPSHLYSVGEKFDITFEIAPRAIDVIKKKNPRACLIGYKLFDAKTDEELVEVARHTLEDSKANIIFANTPAEAKTRKIVLTQDGAAFLCNFFDHIDLIKQAISLEYYKTKLVDISCESLEAKRAIATVKMFEKTFPKYGTVAVPVGDGTFATTARGHRGEPVLVSSVEDGCVLATNKATLNAPVLAYLSRLVGSQYIIVHRHEDDPLYSDRPFHYCMKLYHFPGTADEVEAFNGLPIKDWIRKDGYARIKLQHHGDISILPIWSVDWSKYYEQFPNKYFGIPFEMQAIIDEHSKNGNTLEIGCNKYTEAEFAYDAFVQAENATNLTWDEIGESYFDLVYAKNAINYFSPDEIKFILAHTKHFVANSFRFAPTEKVTEREAAICYNGVVYHTLRLPDDSIIYHDFYAYETKDWEAFGLQVKPYDVKSILLIK